MTFPDENRMREFFQTIKNKIDSLIPSITTAQQTANTAASAAEAAQSSANTAQESANNAKSTANAAKTIAEAALPKSGGIMSGYIDIPSDIIIKTVSGKDIYLYDNGDVSYLAQSPNSNIAIAESKRMSGVKTPIYESDAANKLYVDSSIDRQNLLDNACWISKKTTVNQRNVTSWKGGYGIDRWVNTENKDTAIISVEDSGIKLTSTVTGNSLGCVLSQRQIYDKAALNGKPVTISVLANIISGVLKIGFSDDVHSDHTHYQTFNAENKVNLYSYNTIFPESINDNDIIRYALFQQGAGEAILYAAKVEIGNYQTLARLDANGNWILNEIPDYATELLKCQRYFYQCSNLGKTSTNGVEVGYGVNTDWIAAGCHFPVTMRAIPTVTFSDVVPWDNISGTPIAVNSAMLDENKISAIRCATGSLTANKIYYFRYTANAEL